MLKFLDLRGPVAASTVYVGDSLVARDVTATLPSVTPSTAEVKAMGPVEMPIPAWLEAMELALTKQGIDRELGRLCTLEYETLEIRWVQDVLQADGTTKTEGCRAYCKARSKGFPGLSVEPGSVSENEMTFSVVRYQLFVGGEEVIVADKFNSILRVNGRDYTSDIHSLL